MRTRRPGPEARRAHHQAEIAKLDKGIDGLKVVASALGEGSDPTTGK